MTALVNGLFVASTSGAPMQARVSVALEKDRGIVGDRYHAGSGKFSEKLRKQGNNDWQVTLIETEEIDAFLAEETLQLGHEDFRRNILTKGLRLNPLVGRRFVVDGIALEGVRLCEPCAYLADLLTDKLLPNMVGRCGLRARILASGDIAVGGIIEI